MRRMLQDKILPLHNNYLICKFNLYIKYYFDDDVDDPLGFPDETGAVAAAPAPMPPMKV